MNKDFCVFILTHGRANNVKTYKTLIKSGYTGALYIVVDNEDKTVDEYIKIYGDKVIVFDKLDMASRMDSGDNFEDRRAIIYARNASFEIAKRLGYKYFMQLDDDYTDFRYKFNGELEYIPKKDILSLDNILNILLEYYKKIPALTIAVAQGGDFIGGKKGGLATVLKPIRKCMNTFICDVDRPFKFVGRVNEDVNTYTSFANRGELFLTIPNVAINQPTTQTSKGGMTEMYLDSGTYIKSFYSVIYAPSCVTISLMGTTNRRLHHRINWNNTTSMILDEKYKK